MHEAALKQAGSTGEIDHGLKHQLSAGQMAMVAVGSSIGVGLLLGSGATTRIAGPGAILSYIIAALICYATTMALGELASAHPAAGSFGVYADLYLNHWAGYVARFGEWFGLVASLGGVLVAAATYTRFWFPQVPAVVWVVFYAALILFFNIRPVADFGRIEYWLAIVKLVTIIGFVCVGGLLLLSHRVEPQFTSHGGLLPNGPLSPLFGLSLALFSFLGIEMVAISSGEARSPAEIPRAIRLTFPLLAFVYVGAITVLVGVLPWNASGLKASPFVTVFTTAGFPAVSHVMNFVVLTAALSCANANLYGAARLFFSLAEDGYAPRAFSRVNGRGTPMNAVLASASGMLLAMVLARAVPESAFLMIVGASLFGAILAWSVSLTAHISFRRKASADEIRRLPMRSRGGPWLSALGLIGILVTVGSTWWVPEARITIVSGVPFLALLTILYFVTRGSLRKAQ